MFLWISFWHTFVLSHNFLLLKWTIISNFQGLFFFVSDTVIDHFSFFTIPINSKWDKVTMSWWNSLIQLWTLQSQRKCCNIPSWCWHISITWRLWFYPSPLLAMKYFCTWSNNISWNTVKCLTEMQKHYGFRSVKARFFRKVQQMEYSLRLQWIA